MEVLIVVGGIVALIYVLSRMGDQARRIEKLEQEIGYARQAYDKVAVRVWQLERALDDAMRALLAQRREAAAPAQEVPGQAQAAPSPMAAAAAATAAALEGQPRVPVWDAAQAPGPMPDAMPMPMPAPTPMAAMAAQAPMAAMPMATPMQG